MPDTIALAMIVNRIAELAPELRGDLGWAIERFLDWTTDGDAEWMPARRARLDAFLDALCVEPYEHDERD